MAYLKQSVVEGENRLWVVGRLVKKGPKNQISFMDGPFFIGRHKKVNISLGQLISIQSPSGNVTLN